MRKLLLACAATVILSGCATSPVLDSKSKMVPSERMYSYPKSEANLGIISVTRDSGFTGSACYVGFYLDGALVAKFDTGERATFNLSPGEHIIGVGNPGGNGLCNIEKGYRKEMTIVIRENETKKYRIAIRYEDGVSIEPTTQI